MPRYDNLPLNLPPRGLCRLAAAQYVGVSPNKFDELVDDLRMPRAKRIDGRKIWDRTEIDLAFGSLPIDLQTNPWDAAL